MPVFHWATGLQDPEPPEERCEAPARRVGAVPRFEGKRWVEPQLALEAVPGAAGDLPIWPNYSAWGKGEMSGRTIQLGESII